MTELYDQYMNFHKKKTTKDQSLVLDLLVRDLVSVCVCGCVSIHQSQKENNKIKKKTGNMGSMQQVVSPWAGCGPHEILPTLPAASKLQSAEGLKSGRG